MWNCLGTVYNGWFAGPGSPEPAAAEEAEPLDPADQPFGGRNLDFLEELSGMPGSRKPSRQPQVTGAATPAAASNATPAAKCASDTPLIAATIYLREGERAVVLCTCERLDQFSWWYRTQAGEFLRFGSRQVAQHLKEAAGETILPDEEHSKLDFCIHGCSARQGRLVATMVAAPDYPPKIVYRLLHQLLAKFADQHSALLGSMPTEDQAVEFPLLAEYLAKYQDPAAAEKLPQLHGQIEDTKKVLYKTIDQVITRGQSLESIMQKSDDLSTGSLAFYKTSKKTRCCTIL